MYAPILPQLSSLDDRTSQDSSLTFGNPECSESDEEARS